MHKIFAKRVYLQTSISAFLGRTDEHLQRNRFIELKI